MWILFLPLSPLILIICAIVYAVLYHKEKQFNSKESFNTEVSSISCKTKKLESLYYINKYEYTYIANGKTFTGHDKEMFLLKQKRNPIPPENVIVEYHIDNPEKSRLKMIDRKEYRKTILISVCFVVIFILILL